MKTAFAVALLGLIPAALAQAPSPTESYGCEPHEDHWHCAGARATTGGAGAATSAAAPPKVTTDDHAAGASESLAPSPTQSYGCQPHGDHWHCEGNRATTGGAAAPTTLVTSGGAATTSAAVNPGPSPTESVGCQPHGDHWHCEGPATGKASGAASSAASAASSKAASGTSSVNPGPSPTESVGCEPHGDHWHCSGPATAKASGTVSSKATTATTTPVKVNAAGLEVVPVVGLFAAAIFAL